MAIAFGSASNTTYGSRTNTTVTAPTGIADGDVLVAQILTSAGVTVTAPAGWSQVGSAAVMTDAGAFTISSRVYTKTAASESGDYTWTHSTASSQGLILRYTGAGAVDAFSSNPTTPADNINTGLSITTTVTDCMLLFVGNDWSDFAGDLTPPTGMTERIDVNPLIYAADQLLTSAGATGNRTMSCNSNVNAPRNAWMIALEPAGTSVNVSVTGQAAASASGDETATGAANVAPTGEAVTSSSGTVSIIEGSTVNVVGSGLSTSSGIVYVRAWGHVPTGENSWEAVSIGTNTWTPVPKATGITWTPV